MGKSNQALKKDTHLHTHRGYLQVSLIYDKIIKEAGPTPGLYGEDKPQPEQRSASSWYPSSKNNYSRVMLEGFIGEKRLLSKPVSLH